MYNDVIDASPSLTFCKHFERSFSFQTCKKRKNKHKHTFSIKKPKTLRKRLFGHELAEGGEKLARTCSPPFASLCGGWGW